MLVFTLMETESLVLFVCEAFDCVLFACVLFAWVFVTLVLLATVVLLDIESVFCWLFVVVSVELLAEVQPLVLFRLTTFSGWFDGGMMDV